ncbi:MAG: ABC transporter ATP-binding protein [Alphaproteobacteria bacterium]
MSLLEAEDLTKSFGKLVAVDGVSLSVEAGELVGLIGPNGAGKTTTFNCLTGVIAPDGGTVRLRGRDVTGARPHVLARRGMVRTFQRTRELATMTVEENVRLAMPDHPGEAIPHAAIRSGASADREAEAAAKAADLLSTFDLEEKAEAFASDLSGGQRKLLELARSLMLDPEILLLDEPFAGVNPTLTAEIATHLDQLNDDGLTLVIIEHELETLVGLVDRLIVLADGAVLASGPPAAIMDDETVIDAYLGG